MNWIIWSVTILIHASPSDFEIFDTSVDPATLSFLVLQMDFMTLSLSFPSYFLPSSFTTSRVSFLIYYSPTISWLILIILSAILNTSLNILVHDVINLYYEHWTDKRKYFYIYLCLTGLFVYLQVLLVASGKAFFKTSQSPTDASGLLLSLNYLTNHSWYCLVVFIYFFTVQNSFCCL